VRGVDDAHAFEVYVEARGGVFDERALAEEDGRAHAARDPLARGLEDARVGALGEHDPFGVSLQSVCELGDDRHVAFEGVALGAARQWRVMASRPGFERAKAGRGENYSAIFNVKKNAAAARHATAFTSAETKTRQKQKLLCRSLN